MRTSSVIPSEASANIQADMQTETQGEALIHTQAQTRDQSSWFISLRSKVILASLTIVLSVLCTRLILIYHAASEQHADDGAREVQRLNASLQTLLERSQQHLEDFATQIDWFSFRNDPMSLSQLYFSGIESLRVTNRQGDVLLQWSAEILASTSLDASFYPDASSNVVDGQPFHYFYCTDQCRQGLITPALDQRGRDIIVHIEQSGAALMTDFAKVSNADISFLHPIDGTFVASTRPGQTQIAAERIQSLRQAGQNWYLGEVSDRYLAIRLFESDWGELRQQPYAIVADMSLARERLMHNMSLAALLSAFAILITGLALFALMQAPVERVRRLATILSQLPKLMTQPSQQWRLDLSRPGSRFRDEIDTLENATLKLGDKLTTLQSRVQRQTQTLRKQLLELNKAKDLSAAVDQAFPMAIVVHTQNGQIKDSNSYFENLRQQNHDRSWTGLMWSGTSESIQEWLAQLFDDKQSLQSETVLVDEQGRQKDFLWLHTRHGKKDGEFLSLGLDISDRKKAQRKIRWMSEHDPASRLLNATAFQKQLAQQLEQGYRGFLVHIGIDGYDELLCELGYRNVNQLVSAMGESLNHSEASLCARLSNEQIAFLCPSRDAIQTLVARLRDPGFELAGRALRPVISGVFTSLNVAADADQHIASSGLALAQVRRHHSGEIVDRSHHLAIPDAQRALAAMRPQVIEALEQNRLRLFFQPIMHFEPDAVLHFEALLRMVDEKGQLISPARFFPAVEEFGLSVRVDMAVIDLALQQLQQWRVAGTEVKLSVNITPETLNLADFSSRLQQKLTRYQLSASDLILEIVETQGIRNLRQAKQQLMHLQTMGTAIAFDDFGVGYTSFEYLRELPCDYVKIDQSFIRDLRGGSHDMALVKSMVEMAKEMGKQVIAEGVETQESADILRILGVDALQGYHIARPLPATRLS